MELNANKLPAGAVMSPLAREVFRVLERYTVFPWPILAAQCKRAGINPEQLETGRLPILIPLLAAGVGRFTSPEKESAVKRELLALTAAGALPR